MVVVFADVNEDNALERVVLDFAEEGGHVLVGKVSAATADALLNYRRIVAESEHFWTVVRFEEQGVASGETGSDELGAMAHVGGEA